MPWPIARTFGECSGTLRSSTVSSRSTTRSAACSDGPAACWVNQSSSGTRSGRASGAASSAKTGDMCASTATGFRSSSGASAAT